MTFLQQSVASKWPRNLDHNYALYGDKAKVSDRPVVQFEALKESKLVTRTVAVAVSETPRPIDKERAITFLDASGNKKFYPNGSLQSGKDHKAMRTWNAQILVKK